jgi:pimeloyl-ACP methyl ester carboxylesterase
VPPTTRYAVADDVHIAYQIIGSGPRDLLFVPGFVSNIDLWWEEPAAARFFERLATFARVILFDKRGTGQSDRVADVAVLERRVDDLGVVLDAAASSRAVIVGVSEAAPTAALFAATHPDRASSLVLVGGMARWTSTRDYPWARSPLTYRMVMTAWRASWGSGITMPFYAPSRWNDGALRTWWSRLERSGASPGALQALLDANMNLDVRAILPTISVPTLVLHSAHDRAVKVGGSRFMASAIPNAKYVELPGSDHVFFGADGDAVVAEIEEFVTGVRSSAEVHRALATILFTDIVRSTETAAELGDLEWRTRLEKHYDISRVEIERQHGVLHETTGDGVKATFDGPARGIRAAQAIADRVRSLGIETRAGLHTGEVELRGSDFGGIAVHIAARVAALAGANEVVVSSTVRDLTVGSGIRYAERGSHTLKGVPGTWQLFAVER